MIGNGQEEHFILCVFLEFPYKIPWGDGESPVTGERGIDSVPQG